MKWLTTGYILRWRE